MTTFFNRASPLLRSFAARSLGSSHLGGMRMMRVASRPSDLVGNTPLIDLTSLLGDNPQGARLLGKLESLGPCSSVKDRLGRSMIDRK